MTVSGPPRHGVTAVWEPLIRLAINAAVPLVVYLLLRPHVHSDLTAPVIWAAIPAAWIPSAS